MWEAVVAGRLEDGETGALVLTGYWTGTHIALDVATITVDDTLDGADTAIVVLGTPHPALRYLDVRWHDQYPDHEMAAHLTREPAPPAPQHLDTATVAPAAALTRRVEGAVAAQAEGERPAWWPAGLPVAAGPVVTDEVHLD